jgi:hypothetical protein
VEYAKQPTFSLRLRKDWVRKMVRELAEHEGISQNEFLEQAAEHEVIARGAMVADDLERIATRLREISDAAYDDLIEASIIAAAESEALADEPRAYQFVAQSMAHAMTRGEGILSTSGIGAVRVFEEQVQ